jgi:hypothetical protein
MSNSFSRVFKAFFNWKYNRMAKAFQQVHIESFLSLRLTGSL